MSARPCFACAMAGPDRPCSCSTAKRAATKGVGVALVKKFNATHPGLKVVLQQTSPNQDTSKLATTGSSRLRSPRHLALAQYKGRY